MGDAGCPSSILCFRVTGGTLADTSRPADKWQRKAYRSAIDMQSRYTAIDGTPSSLYAAVLCNDDTGHPACRFAGCLLKCKHTRVKRGHKYIAVRDRPGEEGLPGLILYPDIDDTKSSNKNSTSTATDTSTATSTKTDTTKSENKTNTTKPETDTSNTSNKTSTTDKTSMELTYQYGDQPECIIAKTYAEAAKIFAKLNAARVAALSSPPPFSDGGDEDSEAGRVCVRVARYSIIRNRVSGHNLDTVGAIPKKADPWQVAAYADYRSRSTDGWTAVSKTGRGAGRETVCAKVFRCRAVSPTTATNCIINGRTIESGVISGLEYGQTCIAVGGHFRNFKNFRTFRTFRNFRQSILGILGNLGSVANSDKSGSVYNNTHSVCNNTNGSGIAIYTRADTTADITYNTTPAYILATSREDADRTLSQCARIAVQNVPETTYIPRHNKYAGYTPYVPDVSDLSQRDVDDMRHLSAVMYRFGIVAASLGICGFMLYCVPVVGI